MKNLFVLVQFLLLYNCLGYSQQLIPYTNKGDWGLANLSGEPISPLIYDAVSPLFPNTMNGLFVAKKGDKQGLLLNQDIVIPLGPYVHFIVVDEYIRAIRKNATTDIFTLGGKINQSETLGLIGYYTMHDKEIIIFAYYDLEENVNYSFYNKKIKQVVAREKNVKLRRSSYGNFEDIFYFNKKIAGNKVEKYRAEYNPDGTVTILEGIDAKKLANPSAAKPPAPGVPPIRPQLFDLGILKKENLLNTTSKYGSTNDLPKSLFYNSPVKNRSHVYFYCKHEKLKYQARSLERHNFHSDFHPEIKLPDRNYSIKSVDYSKESAGFRHVKETSFLLKNNNSIIYSGNYLKAFAEDSVYFHWANKEYSLKADTISELTLLLNAKPYVSFGNFENKRKRKSKDILFGLISLDGREIFPEQYTKIEYSSYSNKNENSLIILKKDGKFGLGNFNGKIILPVEYEEIRPMDHKYASVSFKKDGKWGAVYSSFEGEFTLPPIYQNPVVLINIWGYQSSILKVVEMTNDDKLKIHGYMGLNGIKYFK